MRSEGCSDERARLPAARADRARRAPCPALCAKKQEKRQMQRRLRTLRRHLPSQRITLAEKSQRERPGKCRSAPFRLVKEPRHWRGSSAISAIIEKKGVRLENWRKNSRRDIVMVNVDALVPKDHLLRKIENVMDYEWFYARLSPYYCADNGRPGSDPVVLIKMVLLQHLYG